MSKLDLRTKVDRQKRPHLMRRACELRECHWTLDRIASDLGIAPATVSALLWDARGLGAITMTRAVAAIGAQKALVAKGLRLSERGEPWTVCFDPDHDDLLDSGFRFWGLYNGAGKLIVDEALATIELWLWIAMQDGDVKYCGADSDGDSLWQAT